MRCLPKINAVYWLCLILASLFGANLGDFLGTSLGLGHLEGLPLLAVGFALVFLAERFLKPTSTLYFWAAIVISGAAAANVADAFHDFHIRLASVPAVCLLLAVMVIVWRARAPYSEDQGFIPVTGYYWVTLVVSGVLGAAAGDAAAYPLGFGDLGAVMTSAIPLAFLLSIGRKGLYSDLGFYWLAFVFVVATGATSGDLLAHSLGRIGLSTALSGAAFLAFVVIAYETRTCNRSFEVQTATTALS
ncbi:hypothetical protein [Pleomorphomonas oryzae]|uniref:hypothetical protein n=1 Tax=Pleomorphomonas oryzae TaxID=261934 RepID=UPI00041261A1|nr:hypothetical protein [Pleomorphomonas oryzae]